MTICCQFSLQGEKQTKKSSSKAYQSAVPSSIMEKFGKNAFKYPKNKERYLVYKKLRFRKELKMAEGSNDFNTSSQCTFCQNIISNIIICFRAWTVSLGRIFFF